MSAATIRTGEAVRKRRSRMPWFFWLFGIGLVILWWALYQSRLFLVEDLKVVGTHRLSADKVTQMANVHLGEPLISVNPGGIAKNLGKIAQIKSIRVERGWPHSVLITVVERSPVAVYKSGKGFDLIDDAGMLAGKIDHQPKKMRVVSATPNTPAMKAAVQIALAIPAKWRVVKISAANSNSVLVQLRHGQSIAFGSGEQAQLKIKVAGSLLINKYRHINVSSPLNPTVRK
jgi:cell division protein FtsQ